jgi:hypothetical protein
MFLELVRRSRVALAGNLIPPYARALVDDSPAYPIFGGTSDERLGFFAGCHWIVRSARKNEGTGGIDGLQVP